MDVPSDAFNFLALFERASVGRVGLDLASLPEGIDHVEDVLIFVGLDLSSGVCHDPIKHIEPSRLYGRDSRFTRRIDVK